MLWTAKLAKTVKSLKNGKLKLDNKANTKKYNITVIEFGQYMILR